jgi:hypothetical protein
MLVVSSSHQNNVNTRNVLVDNERHHGNRRFSLQVHGSLGQKDNP